MRHTRGLAVASIDARDRAKRSDGSRASRRPTTGICLRDIAFLPYWYPGSNGSWQGGWLVKPCRNTVERPARIEEGRQYPRRGSQRWVVHSRVVVSLGQGNLLVGGRLSAYCRAWENRPGSTPSCPLWSPRCRRAFVRPVPRRGDSLTQREVRWGPGVGQGRGLVRLACGRRLKTDPSASSES
jgi:hypothetical protein